MIKIGLAGGRGYVGEELLSLLVGLPDYQVAYVGSRGLAGEPVGKHYQNFDLDLCFEDLSADSIKLCDVDAWVIAQNNGESDRFVEIIEETSSAKIIDVSSDHRFDADWVYGLPEKNKSLIQPARQIANPGCYATAIQLALLPLADRLENVPRAFGISGYSGAGRKPNDKNDPQRLPDNILPYSLAGHTHELEVSHQLGFPIRFVPHVAPFFRGISVTVDLELTEALSDQQMVELFDSYYAEHPLVTITQTIPEIRSVVETNMACVGGFTVDPRDAKRIAIVSVIDNLRKGAASQVIQNLNLMFDLKSENGLTKLGADVAAGRIV